jgi:hypothetical protein
MSEMKVRGRIHLIEQTKSFGQKGFRKRLVVLEQDNGRFVNYIPLEFISDACDTVDNVSVGDEIEANVRLSGRKWQRDPQSEVKFFLSAEATGYQRVGEANSFASRAPQGNGSMASGVNDALAEAAYDDGNDVPF